MVKPISDENDEIICKCFQVSENVIRSFIKENDVSEIDGVTLGCKAGGNCKSCHILIQLFIDEYLRAKEFELNNHQSIDSKLQNRKGFFSKIFSKG